MGKYSKGQDCKTVYRWQREREREEKDATTGNMAPKARNNQPPFCRYALTKHPTIMKIVKERGIAIEVNPISNQVLNLVADMRNHPASFLFSRDFPVVVSSDDPGMWGAVGLSYDFYESFVGIMSRSADIRALKQLAMNSIKYSAMSDEEKARAYKIWKAKWTTFVKDLGKTTGIVPGNSSDNSCLPKRNNASSITSLTNILHVATLLFAYVLIRS